MNANDRTAPGGNAARKLQASKDADFAAKKAAVIAQVKAACAARLAALEAA